MIVQTSRFGPVEVDEGRAIEFPRGILGFPQYKSYILIQPEPDSTFYWLQSLQAADLAFVVTDPLFGVALVALAEPATSSGFVGSRPSANSGRRTCSELAVCTTRRVS